MKLMEKIRQKRLGNKGFSLVELIIVIAVMAVLLGIVGTQVVPYLQRAREEKDMQIVSSFATAAVTLYSLYPELIETYKGGQYNNPGRVQINLTFDQGDSLQAVLAELTGYKSITDLKNAMSSAEGKKVQNIRIIYNLDRAGGNNSDALVAQLGQVAVQASEREDPGSGWLLEPVYAQIGKINN